MAKHEKNTPTNKPKQNAAPQGKSSTYYLHNGIIILVMAVVFVIIYNLNSKRAELPALYNEFNDLKDNGGDHERMHDVAERIKDIEVDTSYFKALTEGYFEEVHYVAMGVYKQIAQFKASVNNGNEEGTVTREDKLNHKVAVYRLLNYVNENTPKNAVILLPPADSLSYNAKWNYLYDPVWVEYFIYPRLCLTTGQEKLHPDLARRITHVLIVKGIGYDKLKYTVPVEKQEKVAILPINAPDSLETK